MSLFKRPAWAKEKSDNNDNNDEAETNIFSHQQTYREIVAEQERKRQALLDKKKAKEERRTSTKHSIKPEPRVSEESNKRRRTSLDNDDDVVFERTSLTPELAPSAKDETSFSVEDRSRVAKSHIRRSPRNNKYMEAQSSRLSRDYVKSAEVVDLGSSTDSEGDSPMKPKQSAQVELVDEEESDDEFAELARRARQKTDPQAQEKDENEPAVQLFISSRIPNTQPLIVWRRISQDLAQIRKVWCQKQKFSEEATREIFFIHRMRRVYDVTTCRSLGLEVDSLGNISLKGAQGNGPENVDKVHLEAVTEAIFRQLQEEKAELEERRNRDLPAETGAEDDREATAEPKETASIRILLKAKGKEDFKLKVKPSTTVSKIIAAYGKAHLPNGEKAFLEFDGDRLDPEDEIQNTEIADMDCIHVHISSSN